MNCWKLNVDKSKSKKTLGGPRCGGGAQYHEIYLKELNQILTEISKKNPLLLLAGGVAILKYARALHS